MLDPDPPASADDPSSDPEAHPAAYFGAFAALRREEPIHRLSTPDGKRAWLITRYEHALVAFKEPRLIKDFRRFLGPEERAQMAHLPLWKRMLSEQMLARDPPDHSRLRRLVSKSFTPRRIADMEGRIRQIAGALLDEVEQRGQMDLIEAYAFPLPIIVISEMLGVPEQDRLRFRSWSQSFMRFGEVSLTDEERADLDRATTEFEAYAGGLFAARREEPEEDLLTSLVQAEEEGDRLSDEELLAMLILLLVGGHETTVNLIGSGALALLERPALWARLREDPSLLGPVVEELLRLHGPVRHTSHRWAAADMEIGGQAIRRGDLVFIAVASINRDEEVFADAERFDPERPAEPRHLAFGYGIHHCLGAPLARLEARIALGALLHRLPDLRLAAPAEQLRWRMGHLVRGLVRLPVAWGR